MKTAFIVLYFLLLAFISFNGIHLYWLISLHLKSRRRRQRPPRSSIGTSIFPHVTVQLPIFNERRVAIRLIKAVAAFDWPVERLEIQVLDDSTDATSDIIARYLKRRGSAEPAVRHLRRSHRTGYKAGALRDGLRAARGEYIAVFDADNVPRPDFLNRTMPWFQNPEVGLVQARWSFLNRTESLLCRAQALFLDAHFCIEQQARYAGNLMFNFNGTAGIWRRQAIVDAGGWRSDTLTEDFDLSIRAQLGGWKFVFLSGYDVPTELPNAIGAFKSQQYRWSKGAMQTATKLLPTVLRSDLPLRVKAASLFHFLNKTVSLALLLLAVLLIPALHVRLESGLTKLLLVDLPIFIAATGSMSLFYSLAYRAGQRRKSWKDALLLPALTSLGVALAVNNSRAILSAIFGKRSSFVRTPKSGSTAHRFLPLPRAYATGVESTTWIEGGLAVYALTAIIMAVQMQLFFTVPFLATFFLGYLYFSVRGVRDALAR